MYSGFSAPKGESLTVAVGDTPNVKWQSESANKRTTRLLRSPPTITSVEAAIAEIATCVTWIGGPLGVKLAPSYTVAHNVDILRS